MNQTIYPTLDTLLDYIAYSPAEPGTTSPSLRGVWTPVETGDAYLCARCYGRLLARGVALVTTAVWDDDNEPVEWVVANERETAGVCANCVPAPAVEDILLSLHAGSTAHDVHDAVEKIHALRYPTGCPGGGCEFCVARLAR